MNEDVKKVVARILKDIQVEMSDEFDKNFERQAFFSEKWQRRKSPIRDEGRAILTDTGALRKSIGSRTTENSITFFTTLPYAAIHNDGGEIVVTGRMKRFFWHKYYEATGAFGRRKDGRLRKDKRNARLEMCIRDRSKPFGFPAENASWFISGASASGKSSFVMQLGKELCKYGTVLYMSYEEKINQSFQRRMGYLKMNEVQGKFRVVTEGSLEEVIARLKKPKSPKFIIIDSFQVAGWDYPQAVELMETFPKKCFIWISQEKKSQPMGGGALRLRYISDMKIRVVGYKAYCQGRSIGAVSYTHLGGILLIMPQPDKGGNIQVFFDVLWMAWRDYWMPIVFLWLTMSLRKRGIKLLKGLLLIW